MSEPDSVLPEPQPSAWCLVCNVNRRLHTEDHGAGPTIYLGTKHFAPGAKLYAFPSNWGDGLEKIRVLGRHRGGGPKLIEMVVSTKHLEDWRAKLVFHPFVVKAMRGEWTEADAVRYANMLNRRVAEGTAGKADLL